MKTLVYGWYSKGNAGDESYKLSFPRLFPDDELTFCEIVTSELVDSHDRIILGGGNILDRHHIDGLKPAVGKKPIYAFSVGCTSSLSAEDLAIFEKIYVRDFASINRLKNIGVEAEYSPDAAFILEPDRTNGERLIDRYSQGKNFWKRGSKMGVIVNCHLASEGQNSLARDAFRFQQFAYDLAAVLDKFASNVYFIPFMCEQPWDDRVTNGWVANRCTHYSKNVVIYDTLTPQETLDMISVMDIVVSTRLHSSIFSTISHVPFVDIHHHDKNKGFLETIGREYWSLPYWDFSRAESSELINLMVQERDVQCETLRHETKKQTDILKGQVDAIRFSQ